MSRIKHRFPARDDLLRLIDDRGTIAIRATPNASGDAIVLPAAGAARVLVIRTTATPEDGKANAAILALLATALGCSQSTLTLVRGATSRDKSVHVAST